MTCRRYIVTCAQNATPAHIPTLRAFERYCKDHSAELLVIKERYHNPTSRWTKKDEGQDYWSEHLDPYLTDKRKSLCRNLRVFGDISIQPTASNPLSGWEVFTRETSGIFGHPRAAMTCVATGTRSPKVLWTTGSITIPNYTPSKAGKKAQAHHHLGGLIVEIDPDGSYFVRRLTTDKRGHFYDLDCVHTPDGSAPAPRAASITHGDAHVARSNPTNLRAAKGLAQCVRPLNIVNHDAYDGRSRSHHGSTTRTPTLRDIVDRAPLRVEDEVEITCTALHDQTTWVEGCTVYEARSNHDEHLESWMECHDPRRDPLNDRYHAMLKHRSYEHRAKKGTWPDLLGFEYERIRRAKKWKGKPVRFLKRNESLKIAGIEHGFHSDKGPNGSRGSILGYSKIGVRTNSGHTHTPGERDGACQGGTLADMDHEYNFLPSSWACANVVTYPDSSRQIVFLVNGRFRGGQQ